MIALFFIVSAFMVGVIIGAFLVVVGMSTKRVRVKKTLLEAKEWYYSPLTGTKIEQNIN
jgi:hypothetical protein